MRAHTYTNIQHKAKEKSRFNVRRLKDIILSILQVVSQKAQRQTLITVLHKVFLGTTTFLPPQLGEPGAEQWSLHECTDCLLHSPHNEFLYAKQGDSLHVTVICSQNQATGEDLHEKINMKCIGYWQFF